MNEESIKAQFKQEGYDEVNLVEWEAGTFNDTHTHEFAALLHVLAGEMTVTTDDWERTCRAGDRDSVGAGVRHSERVGPEGVKFLVGRT